MIRGEHRKLRIANPQLKQKRPVWTLIYECGEIRISFPMRGLPTETKNAQPGRQSMSAERFELSTNGLKGRCSAVELRARASQSEGHSIMGGSQRQRKTLADKSVYRHGGFNGRNVTY
jgi:hypothetical protein